MKSLATILFVAVAGCAAWGQEKPVDWNFKCSDGSMCQKDVEPGRCVCVPSSVSVKVLPPDSIKSFEISKNDKCPDGFSKQWGTGYDSAGKQVGDTRYDCIEQPKPLKCGKWEHRERVPDTIAAYYCADNMHSVTEKQWQELQQMLREWKHFHGNLDKIRAKLDAEQKK